MPIVSMYPQGSRKQAVYQNKNKLLAGKGEKAIKILDFAGGDFSKGEGL